MDTKNEQPFFARFLEGQEFLNVKTNIKAGQIPGLVPEEISFKYPSDDDEGNVTLKYPSDGDEGGV